jgi:hypothetical protein
MVKMAVEIACAVRGTGMIYFVTACKFEAKRFKVYFAT